MRYLWLLFLGSCCALFGRWEEPDVPQEMFYMNGHPLLDPVHQSLELLAYEQKVGELVEGHRAQLGYPPLPRSPFLNAVARAHARHMIEHGFKAHENPEGDSPMGRIRRAGGDPCRSGENIAWEWVDAEGPFTSWMNSPPHRENIERRGWTATGVGAWRKTQGALTFYVAQVFVE